MKQAREEVFNVCVICILILLVFVIPNIITYVNLDIILISFIICVIPFSLYFVIREVIKLKRSREINLVLNVSKKIKQIKALLDEYEFYTVDNYNRKIEEREFSRKSFERVKSKDIILNCYDNNDEGLLDDVKKAFENRNMYVDFLENASMIDVETSDKIIEQTGLPNRKFIEIENKIVSDILNDKEYYNIKVHVIVRYISKKGQVNDSKERIINYVQLFNLFEEWNKGKQYATSMKIERSIMNDDIRYNVLRRDEFTCQSCGATVSDGVKLHVDHIIPISRGGKTIMSNLQTLCNRCNKGKGNKMIEDYKNNMICPKCGSRLVVRESKKGKFLGCTTYPKCHYIGKYKKNNN